VSSLADPVSRPQRRTVTIPLPRLAGNGTLATGIAVAIAAASFAAAGGLRLERTTNVLIAMILASAALVVAALLQRPWTASAPLYGGGPLLAFALLAGLTALSVLWSLAPADSWIESIRTFAYLSLFAAGIAFARLAGLRWPALLVGVGAGCLLVCAWALLTKVFPASLAPDETYARLREPFAYWNSVGLMAALGVPPMLWLAARRNGHAAVNALAWPAIGLLLVCMMLSYSRGALAALAFGIAAWFVLVPLRLRALVTLAGRGALAVLALVPLLGLVALATAEGGIKGQVSKGWDQLTDPNAQTPANTPDRLTATSSVRARYWREALDIHATEPWLGSGAGAYATVRSRFRDDALFVRHAHGYVMQTLADFGWIGLIVSLLAAGAWLLSAARVTGVRRKDRGLPYDAERIGMLTLVVVVLVFAAHSLIDWTWFVPANAGVAVLCAGWVAGRGPLRVRLEHPEGPPGPEPLTWPHASRLARLGQRMPPLRALAVFTVVAIALVGAWTALQPVRSVHAGDAAFDKLDQGQPDAAVEEARKAVERNPLAVDPLFELAAIEEARGQTQEAERTLERAVDLQPANAETWRRLGRFRLSALNDAKGALSAFQAAYYLDPHGATSTSDVIEASRAAATGAAPTP
jgi:hypothetical protein